MGKGSSQKLKRLHRTSDDLVEALREQEVATGQCMCVCVGGGSTTTMDIHIYIYI